MNQLVSEAKYDIAYAELQNTYADIFTAVGQEVYGDIEASTATVDTLTEHLRGHWQRLKNSMAKATEATS